MIDIVAGGGVTTIIMSTKEANQLARELHGMDMYDSYDNVMYKIYEALVPTEGDHA